MALGSRGTLDSHELAATARRIGSVDPLLGCPTLDGSVP